jgi:competence protein ComEA
MMGDWLERYRVHIVSALALLIVAGLALLWIYRPRSQPIVIYTPIPTATPTPVPTVTPAPLRVYITGAVKEPDVYFLSPGSIVKDALLAAGGATDDADLDRVNLALELSDQQQVYVPRQGGGAAPIPLPTSPGRSSPEPTAKVNLNTATAEELDALPGIGPAIAQRIIDYRAQNGPFSAIEEVMEVKGIGPVTFADLRERITVE